MNKVIIQEWDDANMAGSEWNWQVWVSRRKDGSISVGAKQCVHDPRGHRIVTARCRLRTGTEVLDAIQKVVEETGYSFDLDANIEEIAARLETLSPQLAKEFCEAAADTSA